MIMDGGKFRSRRIQLALTMREVANSCGVTTTVITRLEKTGDVSLLQVKILMLLMETLGLDFATLFSTPNSTPDEATELKLRELGQILFATPRAIKTSDLAKSLGVSLEEIDLLLQALDTKLRPCGMKIHNPLRGVSIIPEIAKASQSESINSARRSRSFDVLNVGDLSLLSKVIEKKVNSKATLMSGNGKATFHKLLNAQLIEVDSSGYILPSESALKALGIQSREIASSK